MTDQRSYSQRIVGVTRRIAIGVGTFFALAAIGGLMLGVALQDGTQLALASVSSGISLSCYLWWLWSQEPRLFKDFNVFVLVNAAGTAGFALYSNLVYGLWALGHPMNIGTVASGRMAEYYWIGPATLGYAVFGYLVMRLYISRTALENS